MCVCVNVCVDFHFVCVEVCNRILFSSHLSKNKITRKIKNLFISNENRWWYFCVYSIKTNEIFQEKKRTEFNIENLYFRWCKLIMKEKWGEEQVEVVVEELKNGMEKIDVAFMFLWMYLD